MVELNYRQASTMRIRRKDYIAYMAVFLFFLILIFEILLVTWLPHQMSSAKLWEREVAMEEMIELEDSLRTDFKTLRDEKKDLVDELSLAQDCLNDFAGYLREYQNSLNRGQICDIYYDLKGFEELYKRKWMQDSSLIKGEKIKAERFLRKYLGEPGPDFSTNDAAE